MVKTKEPMKAQPPMISRLYSKYENITLDHCKTLLIHLYEGKLGYWVNPITGNTINNSSYITISFLSKCYYIWGNKSATINSKKLKYKKHIEKFIVKEFLFDIPSIKSLAELRRDVVNADDKLRKKKELGKWGKRGGVGSPPHKLIKLTDENEKRLAIPIIDGKLNEYIEKFNTFLDKLKDNCNANGILKDHIHISNIVNAIIVIICTKYLHLYDEITPTTYDNPLQIYMYDDTIDYDKFKENYNGKIINDGMLPITTHTIYQKDDLMQIQKDTQIDLKPKTIDKYKENTLFNRQYVFELSKKDTEMTIKYNMINNRKDTFEQTFDPNKLATTLGYAYELLFNKNPFNYNITNSTLPKKINIECSNPSVLSHFDKILNEINTKLENLQIVINDVRSKSESYYNSVIFDMKLNGFGYNELIRKNILYSLNAQYPSYIEKYIELYNVGNPTKDFYKDEIYYNYGYTGTFPIFTWIPISQSGDASATDAYYNFPSSFIWQPYGADNTKKFIVVEKAYKNYYTPPFSKSLNETIYKVISEESTIVDTDMMKRINETIGIYKDMDKEDTYKNKKIYLYHGTNTRLHNMDGKLYDIEILGFLSTTLNVYAASFYSEAALMKSRDGGSYGYIYIIEVDDEQTYINLNDNLYQFILLPHSIIRILYTFDYMGIKIILCRLIKTPTKEKNNELYKKLFDNNAFASAKVALYYFIKQNANAVPICAGFKKQEDFKKAQRLIYNRSYFCITKITDKYMDIFQIPRDLLMSVKLPSIPTDNKLYVYFSLLQENELYLRKDEKTKGVYGGFADIKYSIHQHFIKDCYKQLKIPCIDYAFLHGDETTNNNIATGILLDDYENNRKYEYKYDINNFLIDCIFNFDSIDNKNKKIDLPDVDNGSDVSEILYADKIEGFRNAGLYINGTINPLFRFDEDEQLEYILKNVKKYRSHLFKYSEANQNGNLAKHFECCNKKFEKLMGIIDHLKEQYLKFINDILQANPVSNSSNTELYELNMMLNNLADTLRIRALFQFNLTRSKVVADFINLIIKELEVDTSSDAIANEIPLPRDAKFADLILSDNEEQRGGKHSKKNKVKVVRSFVDNLVMKRIEGTDRKGVRKSSGTRREEANKEINASISQYKSLYKFEDLPKSFQKYYGKKNKGKTIDISNGCHVRMVPRKDY